MQHAVPASVRGVFVRIQPALLRRLEGGHEQQLRQVLDLFLEHSSDRQFGFDNLQQAFRRILKLCRGKPKQVPRLVGLSTVHWLFSQLQIVKEHPTFVHLLDYTVSYGLPQYLEGL